MSETAGLDLKSTPVELASQIMQEIRPRGCVRCKDLKPSLELLLSKQSRNPPYEEDLGHTTRRNLAGIQKLHVALEIPLRNKAHHAHQRVDSHAARNQDDPPNLGGRSPGRREYEAASDAHAEARSKDLFHRAPEPRSWRVIRRLLYGELEVGTLSGRCDRGRRCECEAPWFGEARDVCVEPLAGGELNHDILCKNFFSFNLTTFV